jgi:hypothetical protein
MGDRQWVVEGCVVDIGEGKNEHPVYRSAVVIGSPRWVIGSGYRMNTLYIGWL